MLDEGPSPDDIRRFGRDTGYCPECGSEIWDQAEVCPECGCHVGGSISSRPPLEAWFRRRWMLLILAIMLIAFVLFFVL